MVSTPKEPDRLDRILTLVRSHIPKLTLVNRNQVGWMRSAGRLARPFAPDLNHRFTTVIGSTVYLPKSMDEMDRDELAITLAHEFVHQLDQKRWGLLFYGSYGLLFPVGRGARAVWERRAYAVDMLIAHERLGDEGLELLLLRLAALFSGPEYLWMWAGRRSAREFLESTAADVRSGVLATQHPYDLILAAWRGSEGESAK